MNKVFLVGNLTADPISQSFDSGHTNCRFTVAVSRFSRNENNQADFISVVTWDNLAQTCSKYLAKGRKVAVVGSIQTGSYEKDGVKRYTVDVRAEQVEFLSARNDDGNSGGGNSNFAPKRSDTIDSLQEVNDGVDDDMPF